MSATFDTADMFLWLLAACRASGLFLLLPIFAVGSVPRVVRIGLAAILAWMVAPFAGEHAAALAWPAGFFPLVLLVGKELVIGVLMGLAVRLIFFALDLAAQILAIEIGLNASPEFDPAANAAGNPLGSGLFYLGLIIFVAGGHYAVIFAFARSFELVPPGLQAPDTAFVGQVVTHTARIFQMGVLMAAPIMATNFLVNLGFSILGRVVPRMNVFILSFSVRILAGFAMLIFATGLIAHYIMQQIGGAPELMLRFMPFGGF
jgi:flagellar biosynthesis protein FliR